MSRKPPRNASEAPPAARNGFRVSDSQEAEKPAHAPPEPACRVDYVPGHAPSPVSLKLLEAAEMGAVTGLGPAAWTAPVTLIPPDRIVAAEMSPRPGSKLLYVGLPWRNGSMRWITVARADEGEIAGVRFKLGRPAAHDMSVPQFAALEIAAGRQTTHDPAGRVAELVALEKVALCKVGVAGSMALAVKWAPLWFNVPLAKPLGRRDPMLAYLVTGEWPPLGIETSGPLEPPGPGLAYPDVGSIV